MCPSGYFEQRSFGLISVKQEDERMGWGSPKRNQVRDKGVGGFHFSFSDVTYSTGRVGQGRNGALYLSYIMKENEGIGDKR